MNWTPIVVMVILGGGFLICGTFDFTETTCKVVMIIRLHAMYLGSTKILVFLVVSLLVIAIATGVLVAKVWSYSRSGKFCMKDLNTPDS
jgi:hypothetical protein